MATYVNDLRLKEIATGDESGTWGTSTNTNLELIAEAFSFGTEAITTNADTHTTTIADGSTDPGRSIYLKYTGTLDSACTITLGPNTVSKLWFIENGTSGSQNIIISQGSGANVTIPAGEVKAVYSDGAGSGAAIVDAFAGLKVSDAAQTNITSLGTLTTLTVDDITIDGSTISDSGDLTLDVGGDIILDADGGDIKIQDGGTDVGIISVVNTDRMVFATADGLGLQFDKDNNRIVPCDASGAYNNNVELGDSSLEFTNLFLSGAATVGSVNGIGILADATNFTDSILISQNASTGTLSSATDNVGIGDDVFAALTSGRNSVAIGSNAMDANTSGKNNVAVGHDALSGNTTADNNVAIGKSALEANTTGASNTAVGSLALASHTTANSCTAVGYNALNANTTGAANTAIGAGALDLNTTASYNTVIGTAAGDAITTGASNVIVGYNAGGALTTGASNTAIGTNALITQTTIGSNTAIGSGAMESNTIGDKSVAVGAGAMAANTTAVHNTAIGYYALVANTTGGNNTAVGKNALDANTTATNNTAVGADSLGANTGGFDGVAVGSNSLYSNTGGERCTAVGMSSLYSNSVANYNTAVGAYSAYSTTTGTQNVAIGYVAHYANIAGGSNVAIGYAALDAANTSDNVCVGHNAGTNITTGGSNTCIGSAAGTTIVDASSCIIIGTSANVSASGRSELVIGISKTGKGDGTGFIAPPGDGNLFQGNNTTTFAQTSDIRIKKNIVDNNIGLEKINQVQVRNFEYKTEDEITELPSHTAIKKEGLQLGVIAQEVEDILPDIVHTEDTGCKTVNPDNLTWYLVNAVKELSTQVDELKTKLNKGE